MYYHISSTMRYTLVYRVINQKKLISINQPKNEYCFQLQNHGRKRMFDGVLFLKITDIYRGLYRMVVFCFILNAPFFTSWVTDLFLLKYKSSLSSISIYESIKMLLLILTMSTKEKNMQQPRNENIHVTQEVCLSMVKSFFFSF